MKTIVILISGRGSNMVSILDAVANGTLPVRVAAVISNRPDVSGIGEAQARGVPVCIVDHRLYDERESFDAALAAEIDALTPDLVVLAGFMRILTDAFVRRYEGRMINIHPSLLPAFPGLHTHRQALAAGVRVHGCTVHFVTPQLDHGPIIVQAVVPVLDGDSEAALAARVLVQEHLAYPTAIRWFVEGRLRIVEGRVRVDGVPFDSSGLIVPPCPSP